MKSLIKHTLGYAGMLGVMFTATGCSDWLDPKPLSFFTPENTFNTYEGLKTSTDMLNRDARYFDFYPTAGSADPDILSEYFFSEMGVNGRTDASNAPVDLTRQITPSANLTGNASQINNYWTYLYKGIKDANTIFDRAQNVDMDEKKKNEVLGLAAFHRAFRYYRLVHQYGDVPFIVHEVLGPRYDFNTTKREAILRYLKNDLETYAPFLSNDVYIGQVTKAAAYHLLAKIDLALGEFDAAVAAASEVIGDGVHHLMTERFGVDKDLVEKDVVWDLHQPDNKALPENKEVLYISIDRYDAGSDMRSAAGLEIKRQIIPWYSAANQLKTPAGENGFADNNEKKNPYLVEYGRGLNTLRATWYHQYSIWTLDDTDYRHKKGNWMHISDLKYNNPDMKDKSWLGKTVRLYADDGTILSPDTIRAWSGWPHYKSNIPDQKAGWWRGGWADWYVFRLAETYLLRAEAYTWLGKTDLAAQDLNKVRTRANARPLDASEVNISQILDERARELFYEEPRKCELTRIAFLFAKTGKADEKGRTYSMDNFAKENYFYNRIMDRTEFYNKGVKNKAGLEYTLSPHHVLWPIAEKAIATNVEGHINQTPGYAGSENNIEPMDLPNP
ncbi:RagB/SusD family nutrient uptake outer membrane protein [Bacteroides sp.]|uniref:RagB/SusD family nutrient uptake outer membrane protein n=1 Tax=Bacteroides sp. TaxID=29523 RepID=UPI0023D350BC|nr:RagB/SusD family nutrient uptake outer membrane protein [Bacteroides sp.]MDE6215584.1 RagB/SusD family nutrient uptake outer membrane protein [Bacteroides sp.]